MGVLQPQTNNHRSHIIHLIQNPAIWRLSNCAAQLVSFRNSGLLALLYSSSCSFLQTSNDSPAVPSYTPPPLALAPIPYWIDFVTGRAYFHFPLQLNACLRTRHNGPAVALGFYIFSEIKRTRAKRRCVSLLSAAYDQFSRPQDVSFQGGRRAHHETACQMTS